MLKTILCIVITVIPVALSLAVCFLRVRGALEDLRETKLGVEKQERALQICGFNGLE